MYNILISRSAEKELKKLSDKKFDQIGQAINRLAINPRPQGVKKLKGIKETLWRIRVRDYRIIYFIEDQIRIVEIRKVGPRKDIYR